MRMIDVITEGLDTLTPAERTELANLARELGEFSRDPNVAPLLAAHTRLNAPSGSQLRGPEGGQYTIQRGDTLSKIARDNNTTVDELMRLNTQITDPNRIYAGAKLNLPNQTPPEASAAPAQPVAPSGDGSANQPRASTDAAPNTNAPAQPATPAADNAPSVPGAREPRSAASVAADPDNTGNAQDPEAQTFVQDTPTAAKQISRAWGVLNDDEEEVFRVLSGTVRDSNTWTRLQRDYQSETGTPLLLDFYRRLNTSERDRYVWDPLRTAGIDVNAEKARMEQMAAEARVNRTASRINR